jgi:hypothetical protein
MNVGAVHGDFAVFQQEFDGLAFMRQANGTGNPLGVHGSTPNVRSQSLQDDGGASTRASPHHARMFGLPLCGGEHKTLGAVNALPHTAVQFGGILHAHLT